MNLIDPDIRQQINEIWVIDELSTLKNAPVQQTLICCGNEIGTTLIIFPKMEKG